MSRSSPPRAPAAQPGRILLIGLDGPMLDVLCALVDGPGPLPCVLERRSISRHDVVLGSYPARLTGRPRLAHAFARLAGRHARVLPASGARPEDPLLREALERFRTGDPRRHAAEGLVADVDLVVQTLAPWHRYEWDPPLAPDTPVLQVLLEEDGSLRCCGPGRWAERDCLSCLRDRAAEEPAGDASETVRRVRAALATGALDRGGEGSAAGAGACVCRLGAETPLP